MIVFRPIRKQDLEHFILLAHQAHLGFYTLPKNASLLEQQLTTSLASFQRDVSIPTSEFYLFVAEETTTQELLGVSAIAATTGEANPLYFFRREVIDVVSPLPAVVKRIELLSPVTYVRGPSEVCALFVLPQHRKSGCGRLLSLARFLFIAAFSERFTGSLFAELRGVVCQDNSNLFWEGIGRHFFNVSFEEVHELLQNGHGILKQFMPRHPIYVALLPKEVQETIGKIDPFTEGAFRMLKKQGFEVTDEVDILDGGPKLCAMKQSIRAIKESELLSIALIHENVASEKTYLVSNERLDFRACYGQLKKLDSGGVSISPSVAQALVVQVGDTIRIYNFLEDK